MDSKGNKNKEDDIIPTKNKNLVILGTIITVMFASAGYGIYTGVKWIHGKVYPSYAAKMSTAILTFEFSGVEIIVYIEMSIILRQNFNNFVLRCQ